MARRMVAGLIVGMLMLGACGGSGSSTEDGAGATTAEAPQGGDSTDDIGSEETPDSGDEGDDGNSAGATGVCEWFTQDDAEAAAGGLDLTASEDNDEFACEYIDAAEYEATMGRVGVRVSYLPEALDGLSLEDWIVQLNPEAQTVPVESIPGAVSVDDETYPAVYLDHEGGVVQVTATRGVLDGAIELAEVIAGNL